MPKYLVSSAYGIFTALSVTGGQTCRFREKVTCNDLASFTLSLHTVCRRRFRACAWTWMPAFRPDHGATWGGLELRHSQCLYKQTHKNHRHILFATATRHWAAIGTSSRMPRVPDCQVMTRRHACLTREPWVCFACKKPACRCSGATFHYSVTFVQHLEGGFIVFEAQW